MCDNGGHLCPKMTHIFKSCRFYQCVSNMLRQLPASVHKMRNRKQKLVIAECEFLCYNDLDYERR